MRCLAPYGRLLEIGKYDVLGGGSLPMQPLDRNIAFEGIDLDRLFFGGAAAEQVLAELRIVIMEALSDSLLR